VEALRGEPRETAAARWWAFPWRAWACRNGAWGWVPREGVSRADCAGRCSPVGLRRPGSPAVEGRRRAGPTGARSNGRAQGGPPPWEASQGRGAQPSRTARWRCSAASAPSAPGVARPDSGQWRGCARGASASACVAASPVGRRVSAAGFPRPPGAAAAWAWASAGTGRALKWRVGAAWPGAGAGTTPGPGPGGAGRCRSSVKAAPAGRAGSPPRRHTRGNPPPGAAPPRISGTATWPRA